MLVGNLLSHKGRDVATIPHGRSLSEAIATLKELRIGALVVTGDTPPLVGIFSERDVVRALATDGVDALSMSVARYMSTDVVICHEATTMQGLMSMMTQRRIRHVPVVENNVLVGMISIGDVVKSRLDELEHEKEDLIQFISAH